MSRKKLSRNAPCPCGSGKEYEHCCYGKVVANDLGLASGRQQPQYPIGTVALYGPDEKTTTKIAAGVKLHDGAEAIIKRWVATDLTTNPKVQQEMKDFLLQHGVKSVVMSELAVRLLAASRPSGATSGRSNFQTGISTSCCPLRFCTTCAPTRSG
jgi:hypothetical protein